MIIIARMVIAPDRQVDAGGEDDQGLADAQARHDGRLLDEDGDCRPAARTSG